jgi:hypothetical protein
MSLELFAQRDGYRIDAGRYGQPTDDWRPRGRCQALDPRGAYRPLPALAAATGLRPEEWGALERRDVDRRARILTVRRTISSGRLVELAKTARSRRQVPLSARALEALELLPPRIDSPYLLAACAVALRPGQPAPARLATGRDRLRDPRAGQALRSALDVRVQLARRRGDGVRARAPDGHFHDDDRAPLRHAGGGRRRRHRAPSERRSSSLRSGPPRRSRDVWAWIGRGAEVPRRRSWLYD